MPEPLLDITDLTLEFDIHGKERGFRSRLAARLGLRKEAKPRRFKAIDSVSLTVQRGERLAIMGHNGAGKSSLLKVIAGVYPTRCGRVELSGSIAPLIELGAGFNQHLSARRNIILNGAMFGYSRREMIAKTPDILDFAGLTEFADVPLRNYSTGMRRRLAFTIATDMRPDLLIIDEIFAGGDLQFVGRAQARMQDLLGRANALLMVSHNLHLLEQFCERGIWLEHGRIRAEGPVGEITAAYRASVPQPVVMQAPANELERVAEAELSSSEAGPTDPPADENEPPFLIDPNDRLHVRFPPACWESVSRCHCQGVLRSVVHPGWKICRRCRTWVNANRLTEVAALRLASYEPPPPGLFPPGLARLLAERPALELSSLANLVGARCPEREEPCRIVHLGCGDGRLLAVLSSPGRELLGIELAPALADQARANPEIEVRLGGVEQLEAQSSDILICIDYLGRANDPAGLLSRMKQALRPGGSLFLCEPVFDDPAAPLGASAALLSRVMYNYLFSRGGIETLTHVGGFVNISECGSWNDWPILRLT